MIKLMQSIHARRFPLRACLLLMVALLLPACSGYRLEGTVVQGPQPAVLVVNKNDPRLNMPGVSGAAVSVTIDPRSLSAEMLATEIADYNGRFSVDVPHMGAGVLEYEVEILCRAGGFLPSARSMKLPGSGKRLLIVMSPGTDTYKPQHDILGETIEMGRQLAPGQ